MFYKKFALYIVLIFTFISCSTINKLSNEYLIWRFDNQFQLCKIILNSNINLDSLINSDALIHSELKSYYKKNNYKLLKEFLICEKYVLIEIEKFTLSISPSTEKKVLEFIFILYKNNVIIEVIRFTFHKEKDNIFKLIYMTENPNNYYMYRRPKVNQPDLPFY